MRNITSCKQVKLTSAIPAQMFTQRLIIFGLEHMDRGQINTGLQTNEMVRSVPCIKINTLSGGYTGATPKR
jgi:hypothetical protein